jgi:hypothetical protein
MSTHPDLRDGSGLNHLNTPRLPRDTLSEEMEYPPCPECNNPGFLTQLSNNTDRFHCAMCTREFGDADKLTTSRNLPRPVRDDFAACIIGGVDPVRQADHRGVLVDEVVSNLREADEKLPHGWVSERFPEWFE